MRQLNGVWGGAPFSRTDPPLRWVSGLERGLVWNVEVALDRNADGAGELATRPTEGECDVRHHWIRG